MAKIITTEGTAEEIQMQVVAGNADVPSASNSRTMFHYEKEVQSAFRATRSMRTGRPRSQQQVGLYPE